MGTGYSIHPGVAWRLVDGVVFMLTAEGRYHQLDDAVSVAVWMRLAASPPSAPPNLLALVDAVSAQFDVGDADASADVSAFVGELENVGAVERVAPREASKRC